MFQDAERNFDGGSRPAFSRPATRNKTFDDCVSMSSGPGSVQILEALTKELAYEGFNVEFGAETGDVSVRYRRIIPLWCKASDSAGEPYQQPNIFVNWARTYNSNRQ
jgi:hypothetical protein